MARSLTILQRNSTKVSPTTHSRQALIATSARQQRNNFKVRPTERQVQKIERDTAHEDARVENMSSSKKDVRIEKHIRSKDSWARVCDSA